MLHALCMNTQTTKSTFVLTHSNDILRAMVGIKDIRVLNYKRSGSNVELMIEQVKGDVHCPNCKGRAQVKERPVVHYIDLPVYGTPMRLAWRKHRMRCPNDNCPQGSWVLSDHRIAAKNCLLTTRAAKWATVQVGGGRTVSEVAAELSCDWHTVNDAVTTYGEALLEADRKRLSRTTAIGLDETKFVALGRRSHADYATTVADVENHQIIDILCQWPLKIPHRRPREFPRYGHGIPRIRSQNSPDMAIISPQIWPRNSPRTATEFPSLVRPEASPPFQRRHQQDAPTHPQ